MDDRTQALLDHVRLVGGDRWVRDELRAILGSRALIAKKELRQVALGCAGYDTAEQLERLFEH